MTDDVVRRRDAEGVAVLVMHRPERRNAMDEVLLAALFEHLSAVERDAGARAVVLTGAGGSFSSGADLSRDPDPARAGLRMESFARLYETVAGLGKPTVAAVAGPCIGAGAEVAAACDLRVGTPGAAIRFPGAQFGVPVGAARLPALVGLSHAKDLLMTSRTVGGDEAYRIGFLNRLVPEPDLEDNAVELAALLAEQRGAMLQKQLIDEAFGLSARARSEARALARWERR
jgi:enoyl-CoA hydratase